MGILLYTHMALWTGVLGTNIPGHFWGTNENTSGNFLPDQTQKDALLTLKFPTGKYMSILSREKRVLGFHSSRVWYVIKPFGRRHHPSTCSIIRGEHGMNNTRASPVNHVYVRYMCTSIIQHRLSIAKCYLLVSTWNYFTRENFFTTGTNMLQYKICVMIWGSDAM